MGRQGIFLDRDGTINEEVDFLSSPDDLRLIPGSAEAIRQANALGFKVIVVTNQSGIARGLLTEEQLSHIHQRLIDELQHHDARIDAIYHCPHHPDTGDLPYRHDCICRKPKTGMIDQAASDHGIDVRHSFVIGDRMIDVQTGINAGATSILVLTGYGRQELDLCRSSNTRIDHVADNLLGAMEYIIHGHRDRSAPGPEQKRS